MVAATGVAADTVRRGRSKAQEATSLGPEARGGRKRTEVHDAQLVAALEALIDSETRGDPMSPLRWTNKSTQALARALTEGGHKVSDFVVRRLLKELGVQRAGQRQDHRGAQHQDRDAQFGYLNTQMREHLGAGDEVIVLGGVPSTRNSPVRPGCGRGGGVLTGT